MYVRYWRSLQFWEAIINPRLFPVSGKHSWQSNETAVRSPFYVRVSASVICSLERWGRIRSADRVEAHPRQRIFSRNFFQPDVRTTGASMKAVRNVEQLPGRAATFSRTSQSPASEGSSQGSVQGRWRRIHRGRPIQGRPALWLRELAEAQSAHRFARRDRATQTGNRPQRYR